MNEIELTITHEESRDEWLKDYTLQVTFDPRTHKPVSFYVESIVDWSWDSKQGVNIGFWDAIEESHVNKIMQRLWLHVDWFIERVQDAVRKHLANEEALAQDRAFDSVREGME